MLAKNSEYYVIVMIIPIRRFDPVYYFIKKDDWRYGILMRMMSNFKHQSYLIEFIQDYIASYNLDINYIKIDDQSCEVMIRR